MVSSASSRGVNAARRVSLLRRLTQYLQSYTQALLRSTFSSVMHRPSAEKLWQHPAIEEVVFPIMPGRNPRLTPLEVQAASYLAASDRIASLSRSSMFSYAVRRRRRGAGLSMQSMSRITLAAMEPAPSRVMIRPSVVMIASSFVELLFWS